MTSFPSLFREQPMQNSSGRKANVRPTITYGFFLLFAWRPQASTPRPLLFCLGFSPRPRRTPAARKTQAQRPQRSIPRPSQVSLLASAYPPRRAGLPKPPFRRQPNSEEPCPVGGQPTPTSSEQAHGYDLESPGWRSCRPRPFDQLPTVNTDQWPANLRRLF